MFVINVWYNCFYCQSRKFLNSNIQAWKLPSHAQSKFRCSRGYNRSFWINKSIFSLVWPLRGYFLAVLSFKLVTRPGSASDSRIEPGYRFFARKVNLCRNVVVVQTRPTNWKHWLSLKRQAWPGPGIINELLLPKRAWIWFDVLFQDKAKLMDFCIKMFTTWQINEGNRQGVIKINSGITKWCNKKNIFSNLELLLTEMVKSTFIKLTF